MNRLRHLHRPNGANATHAEGFHLGQFAGIQNKTILFGDVIKRLELVPGVGRRMKGDDDGRLDGRVQKKV